MPRRLAPLALAAAVAAPGCAAPEAGPAAAPAGAALDGPWPPRVGARYPDLALVDADGTPLQLAELAGRVLLVEPVGMSCPGCNAFAGGNRPGVGGLRGMAPQAGLPSIEEMVQRFAPGVSLADPQLAFVVVLLYDYEMGAPDLEDAREWRRHFGAALPHARVAVPTGDLRGPAAYGLIPGFQLVDRDFVLRWDSTGHRPRHDLWEELLPALPGLLASPPA